MATFNGVIKEREDVIFAYNAHARKLQRVTYAHAARDRLEL